MKIIFNPTSIPASFRAAQYGDGCFTTMLLEHNQIKLWHLHLSRLAESCEKLSLAGFDPVLLRTHIESWLDEPHNNIEKAVLKILISAPAGGRGYSRSDTNSLDVVVTTHAYPEHYLHWQQHGIAVNFSDIRLGQSPQLAGLKHLNRLEQVLVKSESTKDDRNISDALVCDTDGMIVEASASNVFWRVANQWFTPDLHASGVAGVQRKHIMERMKQSGRPVIEVRCKPEILASVDELFLCNCVMGLIPVNKLVLSWSSRNERVKSFAIHSRYFQQLNALLENAL